PTTVTSLPFTSTAASPQHLKFKATFTREGIVIGNLTAGLVRGNATLRFVDATADNLLDAGDYFAVTVSSTGCYHFEVFQIDVGRVAGFLEWGGGCPST